MKRLFACMAVLAACAGGLGAETRVVSATTGGKTSTFSTAVREAAEGSGTRITQESEDGTRVETLVEGDGTVKTMVVESKDGTMRMVSDGRAVAVSGTWKGSPLDARCDLRGLGFYGTGFDMALRALARNGLQSLKFPMIQPMKPSQTTVMELKREGAASFKGRDAIKVKISPAGAFSLFWSAHFVIAGDGTVLRYDGDQGPGTPKMVTELVEVRP